MNPVKKVTENNLEKRRIQRIKKIINGFAHSLLEIKVDPNLCRVINSFSSCKGKIVTTGMGKAGIAMRKFSSTLCSLGFPSCFLHPGEASHGDLGVISREDIIFVASNSGKTREILEIIELARRINAKEIIGITSHKDSPLRQKCDTIIDMGQFKEAGKLGLAPTTSILIMLAITDAVAITASEERGFTREDYGKYHHGGYLGSVARRDAKIY